MEKYYVVLWCIINVILLFITAEVSGQCATNEDCVTIKSCPSIVRLLQQDPLPPQDVQRIKNSQCGYDYAKSQPKVCCPEDVEQPKDYYSDLLPNADVCGQDPSKRIVGGTLALLRQFPWLALLEYQKPEGKGFHCGGSLINNQYVLTAAHCTKSVPKEWRLISVRLGEHRLDTNPDCDDLDRPGFEDCADAPIDIPIQEIIVHPKHRNVLGQPNDIMLLRLQRPVTYTDSIQPICLPTSAEYATNDYAGSSMTVAGFGRTETRSQSNLKLKLEVPLNPVSQCTTLYKSNGVTLSDKQFCAGGVKGQDSCAGDSGGPLMHLRQTDTEFNWYLYGVVSFGPIQCGSKDFPGIYTKVPKYMSWIIDTIKP